MFLGVVGISHNTAPVEVRETLSFEGERLQRVLGSMSSIDGVSECCVLSTCNRTEFYLAPEIDNDWSRDDLVGQLENLGDVDVGRLTPYLYVFADAEAVTHLFEVAAGMDSMVVGETQIACQVKDAYAAACDANSNGVLLNRLFHQALETGKKVRSHTRISEGSLSVSLLACDLARKIFSHLDDKVALLIGAGETAELTARHLKDRGVGTIRIANRTAARAEELADKIGGVAVPFDDLKHQLRDADMVIASTAATEPVLRYETVEEATRSRRGRPVFMIDLGVPRDIDPSVDKVRDVFRYDMDDLQKMVASNRETRMEEMERARRIVHRDVGRYVEWTRERQAAPTIVALQELFESVRERELKTLNGKLNPEQYEAVDVATRAMMKKILSHPIVHLKDAAKREESSRLIATIRDVLGLHED